ncbi:MAG: DUF3303 family protein [Dehalococcoidia bacterium]
MATTTYIGFFRPNSDQVIYEAWRETGANPAALLEKVRGFPASLPSTCKLVGSWVASGGEVPGVMVVETESYADIQHINQYYYGWLRFDWHPVATGGVART